MRISKHFTLVLSPGGSVVGSRGSAYQKIDVLDNWIVLGHGLVVAIWLILDVWLILQVGSVLGLDLGLIPEVGAILKGRFRG